MTSSRVPPVPPDKNVPNEKSAPATHRKVVKVEKIEKVSEVDEDQTRARKFREMVEQPEDSPSEHPTPFDLFTSASSSAPPSTSAEEEGETAGTSVAGSHAPSTSARAPSTDDGEEGALQPPPPSVSSPGVFAGEGDEEPQLPQSPRIWAEIDEPPGTIAQGPSFQETPRSASRVFGPSAAGSKQTGGKTGTPGDYFTPAGLDGKEAAKTSGKGAFPTAAGKQATAPSPFGVPGKSVPSTPSRSDGKKSAEREAVLPPAFSSLQQPIGSSQKKGEGLSAGKGMLPERAEDQVGLPGGKGPAAFNPLAPEGTPATRSLKQGEKEPESKKTAAMQKGKEGAGKKASRETAAQSRPSEEKESSAISQKQEREGRDQKKKSQEEEALQITSPSLTQLSPDSIPIAQAAAAAATPYLGPEALAVYFHMIGTIVAMVAPSGDSRTEFILNSPSFANSKFFGSTITIERYATAPDALNIRLTGSTEAVNAFNQNIPNLMAAFRRGKFAFVINRIEAAYEKPLFRRKEAARDKGLDRGKK